jgi:hypothetical protein
MNIGTISIFAAFALAQAAAAAATPWAESFDGVAVPGSTTPPLDVVDGANTLVGRYLRATTDLQGAVVLNSKGYSFAIRGANAHLYDNEVFPVDGFGADSFPPFRAIGYLSSDCSGQAYLLVAQAGYVVQTTVFDSNYQTVFTPLAELPLVRSIGSVRVDNASDCGRLSPAEDHPSVSAYPNSEFVSGFPLAGYVAPLSIRIADDLFSDGFEQPSR